MIDDSKAANAVNRLGGVAYEDEVHVTVDCYIGFIERLRILWHGRATVHVTTKTQNLVGETISTSIMSVPRVFPQRKQGYVEMTSEADDPHRSSPNPGSPRPPVWVPRPPTHNDDE